MYLYLYLYFELWSWNYVCPSPWKFCLGQNSETINSNCFILFREYQPDMGLVHYGVILTLTLTLCLLPSKCCLVHCSEIINDNCFILSGHINLTSNFCTVKSFDLLMFYPWNYDLWLKSVCPNLVWPVLRNYTWKLFHNFRADQSCTVRLFWPFDLQPWKYALHHENIVWAIAQKL